MASAEEVHDSLVSFADSCNKNDRLTVMNRDWNRTVEIHVTDENADFTLVTVDGHVAISKGKPATADMIIQAVGEVLTQIFYGEVSPTEPYNDGTLRVQGTESDILHLDFITAMLWE